MHHDFPIAIPILGMILGAMGIIAWVMTTAIKARHGYPLEDGAGNLIEPGRANELLSQENAQLRAKIDRLEDRLSVLERIATDPAARLDREIDALRNTAN